MEGFILAAGLGTRLRPLTDTMPKALVDVAGMPAIERVLRRMEAVGIRHVVVNVHHFASQVVDYLSSRLGRAEISISDESGLLLDTGAGLKKAAKLCDSNQPILMHNVDIMSDINLQALEHVHSNSDALATLCVSDRRTSRMLVFDNDRLVGWHNVATGETLGNYISDCLEFAYSGIAIVSPHLIDLLPPDSMPYPLIPSLIRLSDRCPIRPFVHDADVWLDVGKPETLLRAQTKYKA